MEYLMNVIYHLSESIQAPFFSLAFQKDQKKAWLQRVSHAILYSERF